MSDEFASAVMRHVVTLLAYNVGWDASQTTALDILADIMRRHFLHLAKSTHNFAEFYGRTDPNLDDVALALSELNMSGAELEEYVQNFDPVTLNYAAKVPVFPLKRESKLNFLRPGSEEVLTRPVHVHEYMPPMIFESKKPEEESSSLSPRPDGSHHNDHAHSHQPAESSSSHPEPIQPEVVEPPPPPLPLDMEVRQDEAAAVEVVSKKRSRKDRSLEKDHHQQQNGGLAHNDDEDEDSSEDEIEGLDSKTPGSKGFVPFSGVGGTKAAKTKKSDNPALKRIRMMIEEDGHPIREVTSVMMTTSGFLSSSREGRLPDTRPPPNREFFDPSPPPPAAEKKKKPLTMKRIVEGIKKIEKESDSADPSHSHSKDDLDDEEEIPLFGNPDKISTTITAPKSSTLFPSSSSKKSDPKSKSARKLKKKQKLKIDKETIKKIAAGLEQRDRDKAKSMKMYKKSQTKVLLDKSKKLKDKKFIQQQLELQKMQQQQQLLLQQQQQFEADAAQELEEIDSDEEMMSSTKLPLPPPMASLVPPALMRIPKKGGGISKSTPGLVDPVKLKKFKNKSSFMAAATAASLLAPPKFGLPPGRGGNLGMERGMGPKKRGRPRKGAQMIPTLAQAQMQAQMAMGFPPGGVPLSAAALANLGRGLMEDRPLKIKKSHMEPDMRSLIPEVQLDLGPHHHVPHHQMGHPPTSTGRLPPGHQQQQRGGQKLGKKQLAPPRMTPATGSGAGYDLLLGLPSAPGLIPSNFVLPPPPPLKKMPTPGANSQQLTPSIHISPTGTPSPTKEGGKKGSPFSNVCSSLTITPIDMGSSSGAATGGGGSHHHKLPPPTTRYDKSSLPATLPSTPPPPPPTLKSKPSRLMRDKSPGVIKSEPSSGITITPIVMEHEHERGSYPDNSGYSDESSHHLQPHQTEDDEYDEAYDNFSGEAKPNVSSSVSMLAKLEEDMKSKEARRKEKERRKELKKEKKKDKKDKSGKKEKRDKDRNTSGGGSSSKKKSSKETLSVPKLTLKLSGHSSGTATPVDSPNPPPVYVGGDSNPMISPPLKKLTIKPTPTPGTSAAAGESKSSKMMAMPKRTPSPELARFSPLVTRTPKAPRAAKVHAAAAVAAEAMGASLAQQMASFPSTSSQKRGGSSARASSSTPAPPPPSTGRGSSSKSAKGSSKSSSALGGLITETVGCIVDESGNKIWICPTCKRQDDGSPMIGCDRCDDWYHFVCQGITDTPEEDTEWYCPRCRIKKKKDKK